MPAGVRCTLADAYALLDEIAAGFITTDTIDRAVRLAPLIDDVLFFHG